MSAEKPDGVAMAQKSKLYFSTLDGSAPTHAITGGVCYCCKTAIVAGRGDAVYAANVAAFETPLEANLVNILRQQVRPLISFVAENSGTVVGHILFSPVSLTGRRRGGERSAGSCR